MGAPWRMKSSLRQQLEGRKNIEDRVQTTAWFAYLLQSMGISEEKEWIHQSCSSVSNQYNLKPTVISEDLVFIASPPCCANVHRPSRDNICSHSEVQSRVQNSHMSKKHSCCSYFHQKGKRVNLLPEVMARTKSISIISTHERAKDAVTHNIPCSQISGWVLWKIPLFHSLNKTLLSDLWRGRGRFEFCSQCCKQAITNIKLGLFSVHLANYFVHHHFLP